MSKTWFTSDTHFGHDNIIRYCDRPFRAAWEMDEALIANWNSHVRPNDIVYHLGDFAFGKNADADFALKIRARLNGHIHLIVGNHEEAALAAAKLDPKMFASVQSYLELKKQGNHAVLFHYPLRAWNKNMRGSWHLYGHCHGNIGRYGRSLDIGMDCWKFSPVCFEQLVQFFDSVPIYTEEKEFRCGQCKQFPCACPAELRAQK